MKIEKVSRYVPIAVGTKSNVLSGGTTRHMLLSIPRLKWLEGGETDHYHKYKPADSDPFIENPCYSADWINQIKAQPLTEREMLVEKLTNDGMTQKNVAKFVGIERGSVANLINRARVKRAYQSLKKEP